MRLGLHLGSFGARPFDVVAPAREAERAGYDCVWVAESWGSDAVTVLTWIAAHTRRIGLGTGVLQIPARTPAATAMAAMTLDHLSGGRFRLGLGVSGPRVAEGWHGAAFADPLGRSREYVELVRRLVRRDPAARYEGRHYRVPATEGTPLRSILHPLRSEVPVYLAALGPRMVALAAEIADGWLPILFSPDRPEVFRPSLESGFARRVGRPDGFDVAPMIWVAVGEDLASCRDRIRPNLALYVGGMGPRGRNFYHALVARLGYEVEAREIQDLFLDGKRRQAAAAVPDALIDEVALVGPPGRIRDRLGAWRSAGVTTLLVQTTDLDTIRILAEANA